MSTKRLFGNIALLVAALLWGSTFVAQSVASDAVEPFTYLASRSLLGFMFLIPVSAVKDTLTKKSGGLQKPTKNSVKTLILGGTFCGIALTVAAGLQQFGMTGDNSGKAGFITAMYILLVPVLGLFLRKRTTLITWICVAMGVFGLYCLCVTDGMKLATSDVFLIICAVAFSVHILIVDYFSPKVDGVKLSCIQFFVVFVLAAICALLFESTPFSTILEQWLPIAYAGILSSGIAYTLQIVGQKHTEPTTASLLMSLESVFAVLSGMVVLNQFPSTRELVGSVVMFAAIIISQLPLEGKLKLRRKKQQ